MPSAFSCDQIRISQPLALDRADKALQARHGVIFHVALVQPEGKLVNVTTKMFFAGVVIDANQAALKHSENALNRVGRYAIPRVLAVAVIDRFMFEKQSAHSGIGKMFVGVQSGTNFDILHDHVLDRLRISRLDLEALGPPAAFFHTEYGRLATCATADIHLLGFVFIGLKTADISFVDFDDALQFRKIAAASLTDAMQHEPRRPLPDADLFRQLQAGNSLAGGQQQIHDVKPLVQRNVAALEYSARAHGKVLLALIAPKEASLARCNALAKAADRARRTIRPKLAFKVGPGCLFVGKHSENLE